MKSLKKGDKVTVYFDISTGTVEWCGIIETGQSKQLGFVPCKELDRPPVHQVPTRPVFPETAKEKIDESAQKPRKSRAPAAQDSVKLLMHGFDAEYWQARDFSDSQKEQMRALAIETGMVCVRDVAAIYRLYGVWDFMSLAFAIQDARFTRQLEASFATAFPNSKASGRTFRRL